MPSESRHPYIALTPNHADFSLQPLTGAAESSTSFTTFLPDAPDVPNAQCQWWQSVLRSVRGFLSLNAGLLLVTGAQAGLSLVNVAVKILQNLDEPISTLEVCEYAYILASLLIKSF